MRMRAAGAKVYRGGWPDFLVVYPKGGYEFVEVKREGEKLRDNQKTMEDVFVRLGLPYTIEYFNEKNMEKAILTIQAKRNKRIRIVRECE